MSKTTRVIAFILAMVMSMTMLASCGQIADQPVDDPIDNTPSVSDVPEVTDTPETTTAESTTTEATTTEPPVTTTEPTTEAPTTTTEATTTEVSEGYTVDEMSAIMYVSISSLNVRTGPSADYDKLTVVYEGDALTVTGRASTGWYRILIEGQEGYVSSTYVTAVKPNGTVTTTTTTTVKNDDDEEEIIDDDNNSSSNGTTTKPNTSVTTTKAWVSDNNWDYMYSLFYSDNYRQVMDEVMEGIQNLESEIYVSPLITDDELKDFCNLILPILPVKYCYVDDVAATKYTSGTYKGYLKSVKISYYVDSKSAADKMVNELESAVKKVLKGVKSSMSDYEKILYLHDWLIKNATPDQHNYADTYTDDDGKTITTEWNGKWGKSIWPNTAYGAIVDGHTTCIGYAKALFYLLGEAGFDCTFAVGVGTSARHIWVKVKCDGKWYNIDPTWNDPCGDTQNDDPNYVCYDFFLVTDDFMARTRSEVFDMRFFADPSCTATKYNWYVYNNCYATTVEEGAAILKAQLKKAAATGDKYAYARVKFSSEAVYNSFKSTYTQSKATSMLSDITSKYSSVKRIPNSKRWSMCYRISK